MNDNDEWGLVIDQVVGLSAVYDIDVNPRTPQEVHDAWQRLVPIIAASAEESLRLSGLELMETTAEMLRSISRNMTSQPFDGSIEIDRLANELDPPPAGGDHPGTDAYLIDRAEHDTHNDTPDREE